LCTTKEARDRHKIFGAGDRPIYQGRTGESPAQTKKTPVTVGRLLPGLKGTGGEGKGQQQCQP